MLRYSLPESLGLRVTGAVEWAGGDYDGAGAMRAFTPIMTGSLTSIAGTEFSDALAVTLGASVAPLSGLSAGIGLAASFRPGATVPYLGFEGSGTLSYRPVNDFSVSVTGGIFAPNGAASTDDGTSWSVSASAAFRL